MKSSFRNTLLLIFLLSFAVTILLLVKYFRRPLF